MNFSALNHDFCGWIQSVVCFFNVTWRSFCSRSVRAAKTFLIQPFFLLLLLQVSSLRGEKKKKELGGSWSCVGLPFTPSVELKPSLRLAYTLHNTRFGLSSLFSGAAVGLAMATTTSGIRHFIRPPLSAANWLCFYKQASSQPANTRWHSLISVSPDRRNTYGGKERKDPNRNLLISTAFFAVFFFFSYSDNKTR